MPHYLIQNPLGQYLTADTVWTSDKSHAARFDDVRSVLKICERENFYDARMMIDFADGAESNIAVHVREMGLGAAR